MRYIIRPERIITTPRLLARRLGARARRVSRLPSTVIIDRTKDFLIAPVQRHMIKREQYTETYARALHFCSRNKYGQREVLKEYFPVPKSYNSGETINCSETPLIIRPFRHMHGEDYNVINEGDYTIPSGYYGSEVYPKKNEYRVICVRGVPIITMVKKFSGEQPAVSAPWNHAQGSSFVTVSDPNNDRLRHTTFYQDLQNCPIIKELDYCGIDILVALRHNPMYNLCEINLCPALTIEDNIRKVTDHVAQLYSS